MQFTIRVVIVITALVALTFRATRTFQQIYETEAEIVALNKTIDKNEPAAQKARNQQRVLQHGIEAAEKYSQVTDRAKVNFVAIQEKYGELKINRPDRIEVVRYPLASYDNEIRWRIYIPESDRVFLRASVVEYRKKVELMESDFNPTVPIDIPMPSGISSVTVRWHKIDDKPTGQVLINDDVVYSTTYEGDTRFTSKRILVPSDTSREPKSRLDLLGISPTPAKRYTFRLQLNRITDQP